MDLLKLKDKLPNLKFVKLQVTESSVASWVEKRAEGLCFQAADGTWMMYIAINATHAADAAYTLTIAGISITTAFMQDLHCHNTAAGVYTSFCYSSGTSGLSINFSGNGTQSMIQGWLTLNAKPTCI